jgi:hypothetical protein
MPLSHDMGQSQQKYLHVVIIVVVGYIYCIQA